MKYLSQIVEEVSNSDEDGVDLSDRLTLFTWADKVTKCQKSKTVAEATRDALREITFRKTM